MMRKAVVAAVVLCVAGVCAHGQQAAKDKPADKLIEGLKKQITASEGAKEKVRQFVIDSCLPLCSNPIWAKETQAQNDKKVPVEELKKIDKQWQGAEEELPIQRRNFPMPVPRRSVRP